MRAFLKICVKRASVERTPLHGTQDLHLPDRIEAEATGNAVEHELVKILTVREVLTPDRAGTP